MTLFYEAFHDKFVEFRNELSARLADDDAHVWARSEDEFYNHKRVRELSIWYGTGVDERGHVFRARVGEWDGTVDWDTLMAIIGHDDFAIGIDQPIGVWNLAKLNEQNYPELRCAVCGAEKEA